MTTCPYCGFEAHTTQQEVDHMNESHPEIIRKRLQAIGEVPPDDPTEGAHQS